MVLIDHELEKLKEAQQLFLKSQEELLASLGKALKEKELPEIPMEGFSRCSICGKDDLIFSHERNIWCPNCGARSIWHLKRIPACPGCNKGAISFHRSGKARCLSCDLEFYYMRRSQRPHKAPMKDAFANVRDILHQSRRIIGREPETVIRSVDEASPFTLTHDEKADVRETRELPHEIKDRPTFKFRDEVERKSIDLEERPEEIMESLKPVVERREVEPVEVDVIEMELIEEEEEEESEILHREVFECPDCGASMEEDEYVCSPCGSEFDEDDEDEVDGGDRADGKDKGYGEDIEYDGDEKDDEGRERRKPLPPPQRRSVTEPGECLRCGERALEMRPSGSILCMNCGHTGPTYRLHLPINPANGSTGPTRRNGATPNPEEWSQKRPCGRERRA